MSSDDDTEGSVAGSTARRADDAAFRRGDRIGRYLVLDRLGAGGMGVVWSAYDPELDRKVAIKLLHRRGGGHTPPMARAFGKVMNALFGDEEPSVSDVRVPDEVADVDQQRLLREAQAAARINHPNVVIVHDVGHHADRVFVAMEYVAGQTLKRWWLEQRRSWREVVDMMIPAALGLAAAHASGLVHRDFKPDNVMVGDDGRVRVMDFGLVRPQGAHDTHDPDMQPTTDALALELTERGSMMGTPAYMAPEQHLGGPIDARTDQFSFCVALWEALYGVRPFTAGSIPALADAVTSGRIGEPPSDREVPAQLRRVVSRGLSVDPGERWPSMDALVAALRRDPVRARRRVVVFAGTIAAALGLVGVHQAQRAAARRGCAEAGAAIAEHWSSSARERVDAGLLATSVPYAAATAERVDAAFDEFSAQWSRVREQSCLAALDTGDDAREGAVATCLREGSDELAALVETIAAAEPGDVRHAVFEARGLPRPTSCTDETELARRRLERDDADGSSEASARLARAQALLGLGRAAAARGELEALLADPELGPRTRVRARHQLGVALVRAGEYAASEAVLVEAAYAALRAGADATLAAISGELVTVIGYQQGRAEDAAPWIEWSRAAIARRQLEGTLVEAGLEERTGNLALSQGDSETALTQLEHALAIKQALLGDEHPEVALVLSSLGNVEIQRKGVDAAMARWTAALAIQERALGPDHPDLAGVLTNLAQAHFRRGELATAKALIERGLTIQRAEYSDEHPEVARSLGNLGLVLQSMGELEAARDVLAKASAVIEATMGPEHRSLASNLSTQGGVEIKLGHFDAGQALLRRALAIQERNLAPDHIEIAVTTSKIGDALVAEDELAEALPWYRRSLTICEKQRHPVFTPIALFSLGDTLRRLDRRAEALPLLERAVAALEVGAQAPAQLAEARMALGLALWSEPADRARARGLLEQARAVFVEVDQPERAAEIDAAVLELAG